MDISTSSLNPTGTNASTSEGSSSTNELISPNIGRISSSEDSLVVTNSNAATAALAAVARQIDTSKAAAAAASWPYNVSAANNVFNNYYTASM